MNLAELAVSAQDPWPVARLTGQVDLSNVDGLAARLEAAVTNRSEGLVLDLSGCTYLDSTGLRMLFRLARRLGDRQQGLRLVVPTVARVARVLHYAGVASVAEVVEVVDVVEPTPVSTAEEPA
jgi:anti-anti-sigma factor